MIDAPKQENSVILTEPAFFAIQQTRKYAAESENQDEQRRLFEQRFKFRRGIWVQPPTSLCSSQEEIYSTVGLELVEKALRGANSCVCVLGQAQTGKTFTLLGRLKQRCPDSFSDSDSASDSEVENTLYIDSAEGLIPKTCKHISAAIATKQARGPRVFVPRDDDCTSMWYSEGHSHVQWQVHVSAVEVCGDEMCDVGVEEETDNERGLRRVRVRERERKGRKGAFVDGLQWHPLPSTPAAQHHWLGDLIRNHKEGM